MMGILKLPFIEHCIALQFIYFSGQSCDEKEAVFKYLRSLRIVIRWGLKKCPKEMGMSTCPNMFLTLVSDKSISGFVNERHRLVYSAELESKRKYGRDFSFKS